MRISTSGDIPFKTLGMPPSNVQDHESDGSPREKLPDHFHMLTLKDPVKDIALLDSKVPMYCCIYSWTYILININTCCAVEYIDDNNEDLHLTLVQQVQRQRSCY